MQTTEDRLEIVEKITKALEEAKGNITVIFQTDIYLRGAYMPVFRKGDKVEFNKTAEGRWSNPALAPSQALKSETIVSTVSEIYRKGKRVYLARC